MTTVVISQPMFFPWIGLFEQIRLADVYVHYVDVQFSRGSYTNRVQIKSAAGVNWLTVPLQNTPLATEIRAAQVNYRQDWQRRHLASLKQSYARGRFVADMIALVESVYSHSDATVAQLAMRSMDAVCAYFGLAREQKVVLSSDLGIGGSGSPRVLEIVRRLQGTTYVTGHGARNYLEHEAFERCGIEVQYMDYRKTPYPQLHGAFTPYVTILDLIANAGPSGREFIASGTVPWRKFTQ